VQTPVPANTSIPNPAIAGGLTPSRPQTLKKQKSSGLKSFFGRKTPKKTEYEAPLPWARQSSTNTQVRPSTRDSASTGSSEPTKLPLSSVESARSYGSSSTSHTAHAKHEQTARPAMTRGMTRQLKRAETDRADYKATINRRQNTDIGGNSYTSAYDSTLFVPRYYPTPELELDKSSTSGSGSSSSAITIEQGVPTSRYNLSKPGLLNVNIPCIEMERYSVMFEKQLQEQKPQQSLLERRNGTLKRLQPVSPGSSRMVSHVVINREANEYAANVTCS